MHREDLLHLIWDAGFQPVERNTRYEVVREYDKPPSLAERRSRAAAGVGVGRDYPRGVMTETRSARRPRRDADGRFWFFGLRWLSHRAGPRGTS